MLNTIMSIFGWATLGFVVALAIVGVFFFKAFRAEDSERISKVVPFAITFGALLSFSGFAWVVCLFISLFV